MQNNASCLLLIGFSHKVYKIRIANKYTILTVIELRPPVWESSSKTTKPDTSIASEQKFCKNRNRKLSANENLTGFSFMVTPRHNH